MFRRGSVSEYSLRRNKRQSAVVRSDAVNKSNVPCGQQKHGQWPVVNRSHDRSWLCTSIINTMIN